MLIPAYNEADALGATLDELKAIVAGLDVVVVDDGSLDATAAVAARHGARVVRLPFNLGVGGAVRTGLRYARDRGYDRVVVFDADGQHNPASVPVLLNALDAGADMAVGSRFAVPGNFEVGVLRRHAMGLLHRIVGWSTGQQFTDTTSGLRAFGRPVIERLAVDYPVEYLADTVEVLLMVTKAGYRIAEVSTPMRPRAGGEPSSVRLWLVLNYLRLLVGILASISRRRPGSRRSKKLR